MFLWMIKYCWNRTFERGKMLWLSFKFCANVKQLFFFCKKDSSKSIISPLNLFLTHKNFRNMIQRIQSVYLFLVVASMASLFFLPFSSVETTENNITSMHVFEVMGHKTFQDNVQTQNAPFYPILILTVVVIVLSLLNLFLYKHRLKQIRLCQLIMLLIVVLVVLIFQQSETRATDVTHVVYHVGTYITVISIVWVFLASKAIKKDEDLVRSADRLR